jgi:hypothetical protein
MTALEYLKGLPGLERAKIGVASSRTPSYINKLIAERDEKPWAPLSVAIACHRHSDGRVDVIGSVRPSGVDWLHLKEYLATAV